MEYKAYKCEKCKKVTIVVSSEIEANRFLVCSHCSSRCLEKVKEFDNLRECMNHSSYRKEHGAIRQVR